MFDGKTHNVPRTTIFSGFVNDEQTIEKFNFDDFLMMSQLQKYTELYVILPSSRRHILYEGLQLKSKR